MKKMLTSEAEARQEEAAGKRLLKQAVELRDRLLSQGASLFRVNLRVAPLLQDAQDAAENVVVWEWGESPAVREVVQQREAQAPALPLERADLLGVMRARRRGSAG